MNDDTRRAIDIYKDKVGQLQIDLDEPVGIINDLSIELETCEDALRAARAAMGKADDLPFLDDGITRLKAQRDKAEELLREARRVILSDDGGMAWIMGGWSVHDWKSRVDTLLSRHELRCHVSPTTRATNEPEPANVPTDTVNPVSENTPGWWADGTSYWAKTSRGPVALAVTDAGQAQRVAALIKDYWFHTGDGPRHNGIRSYIVGKLAELGFTEQP